MPEMLHQPRTFAERIPGKGGQRDRLVTVSDKGITTDVVVFSGSGSMTPPENSAQYRTLSELRRNGVL